MTVKADAKVVLITGALSDIGRATAQMFARAGYGVVVNYRKRAEQAIAFAEALCQEEGASQSLTLSADVRSYLEVQAMFDQIYKKLGRLDVLVNMAGINRDSPLVEMGYEDWETVVATILTGTFHCSQAFAQRYSGNGGNIINVGAVTALSGRKNGANYCSARAGVLTLTKCLALELAPRIRVNTVTPGYIDTNEVRQRHRLTEPAKRAAAEDRVPLGRLGVPGDIAAMIAFLVQEGQYITGQNFLVDGGYYMR